MIKTSETSKKSFPLTEVTFQKSIVDKNPVLTTENSYIDGVNISAALGE